jgi:putative PEP-CTERM system histidine kinase
VGRPVFYYSSVSLTLAGAFLLTMAVLSKVLPVLTPEWKRGVSIGFYLLVGGGGLLLTLSPRANRALKRSIDRNFYANRYDYPREWERVSRALQPATRLDDVCRQIEGVVAAVFDAERVAIHLRERPAGPMRRVHGPTALAPTIDGDNPLVRELERNPEPLVFRDLEKDLDLIPVAVENRPLIQALNAEVVAPLCVAGSVRGLLWLPLKRSEEHYSHEDIELLGAMALQSAAALAATTLAEQGGEARAMESIGRLSAYVVRDLEAQASTLASALEAARRRHAEPGRETLVTIERAVGALHGLIERVTALARPGEAQPQPTGVHALLEEAAATSGLKPGERNGVSFRMAVRGGDVVHVDRAMTMRLLVHLLTNARQALNGSGEVDVLVENDADHDGGLTIRVRDSGRGMSEDFIRTTLFRPFASTRPGALGLGLSQCKRIVEAHGGSLSVESRPGAGTTFKVHLPSPPSQQSPPSNVRVTHVAIDGRPAA